MGLQHHGDAGDVDARAGAGVHRADHATVAGRSDRGRRCLARPGNRGGRQDIWSVAGAQGSAGAGRRARARPFRRRRPLRSSCTTRGRPTKRSPISAGRPPTATRAGTDIAPSVILADILKQRVLDQLRTADGVTYTVNAGEDFSPDYPGWGRISLLIICKPQSINRAYVAIDAIAADLAAHPVSADELDRAVRPEVDAASRSQQILGILGRAARRRADRPAAAGLYPPDHAQALRRDRGGRPARGEAVAAARSRLPHRGAARPVRGWRAGASSGGARRAVAAVIRPALH